MRVRDIMRSPVIAIKPEELIEKALEIMYRDGINGMPVVDEDEKLIGFVVRADIYRFLIDPGHYKYCPVEWVMTKRVLTASPEDEIVDVARRLRKKNIIAIPVVENNKVIGIVSIENLVDHYIEVCKEYTSV
ncbi:MAG: CBS domain-containing protein [Tissierellaceae bacterium]|nr:CBS domain-containing protein [Tissierellaceae bacterium]